VFSADGRAHRGALHCDALTGRNLGYGCATKKIGMMKHSSGPRRGRPRGNGKRFSSGKHGGGDNSGSDAKIRGSAQQVHEKYLALARDAVSAGDRIGAENFFQFADHYYRVFNASNANANSGGGNGGNGRGDRNDKIPPPPASAAAQIVIDETGASVPVSRNAERAAAESDAQADTPAPKTQPVAEAQPVPPASQAAELAEALAKAGPDEAQAADQAAQTDEAPERTRRSPLRTGAKRTTRGRPRKVAEAEGSEQPESPEVKPVRRRVRRTVAPKKPDEATPDST